MKTKDVVPQILTSFVLPLFILLSFVSPAEPATIRVPADQQTIQAGIDAATAGDTVLVADGTYTGEGNKNLDFKGKAITVQSENGAETCVIDCENEGRGFYFHSGETAESVVSGFTVKNGKADGNGGAIYCISSSPTIMKCTITSNKTYSDIGPGGEWFGGGICCEDSSSPAISSCIITGNSSRCSGGGISCRSSSPVITNCIITNNEAQLCGYIRASPGIGGGISCYSSSPIITNCTFKNNTANGALYCDASSSPKITNSIFWDNSPSEIVGEPDATYSDVEGGYTGLGNIEADPMFGREGVCQLDASSPCIDSGTSSGAPSEDIDGTARPQGAGYDMGAYEYFLAPSAPKATTGSATGISDSSATLNGTVNPNGGSSWYYLNFALEQYFPSP